MKEKFEKKKCYWTKIDKRRTLRMANKSDGLLTNTHYLQHMGFWKAYMYDQNMKIDEKQMGVYQIMLMPYMIERQSKWVCMSL